MQLHNNSLYVPANQIQNSSKKSGFLAARGDVFANISGKTFRFIRNYAPYLLNEPFNGLIPQAVDFLGGTRGFGYESRTLFRKPDDVQYS